MKKNVGRGKGKSTDRPFRGGFGSLYRLILHMKTTNLNFTPRQKDMIMASPFGPLINLFMETNFPKGSWEKTNDAITELIGCYVPTTSAEDLCFEFNIKGQMHKLRSTPEELGLCFGLPCFEDRKEEHKVAMSGGGFRSTEFYTTYFRKKTKVTTTMIEEKILSILKKKKETQKTNEHLVLLFCYFLCTSLFLTTTDAGAIKEQFLGLVQDYQTCVNLSWPHIIHEHLSESVYKNWRNPHCVAGCVVYLLVSYVLS